MLCRNLLRCRQISNLFRTYYPYTYDNSFNNRVLDHDIIPPVGRLDFAQRENDFFHKLLASHKLYVNTIAFLDYLQTGDENCTSVDQVLNEDYDEKPAYVLLCYLKMILKSCNGDTELIENTKVVALCRALSSKISELRDEHLWNLMKVLTLWPNRGENQQFFDLCKFIDEEAVRRSRKWGYNSILLTMDHFYRLKTIRYSQFVFDSMKRLWRNPSKLTPQQVVHAMFLVKTYKKWHPAVDLLDVESVLSFHICDLSVEEVGVLAVAFSRTLTPVQDVNLVELMYNKLETRIDNVDPLTLSAFLKFFRLCTGYTLVHKMRLLFDRLSSRIDDLPNQCCTHLALLGTSLLVFHEPIVRKICEKFYDNIESLRLKDIDKLALVLQRFNYIPESRNDILKRMMESIRQRDQEINDFPRMFVSTVYFVSVLRYYDYELINRALSSDFLKKTYGAINPLAMPTLVTGLSVGVKLECPDYEGSYLNEYFIDGVFKKDCSIPDDDKKNLGSFWLNIFSVRNIVWKIFGDRKYAHLIYLLPYSPYPELIFCMKDNKPLELPNVVLNSKYLPVQRLPNHGEEWYSIEFISKSEVIDGSNQLCGSTLARLRHLELLGVKTIQIQVQKYEEEIDKVRFIKNLINEHTA